MEYDYQVAPGADVTAIHLIITGAQDLHLDDSGNLVAHTAAGDIVQNLPVVYQERGGIKRLVHSHYILRGGNDVGFALDDYDRSASLTIDPVLNYSTYLGGGDGDSVGNAVAVDSAGDAYLTGYTFATTFPTTTNAFQGSNASPGIDYDAFISKLNPSSSYSQQGRK